MKENDVKFFRPLWVRVLVTAVCAVWCLLEIVLSHDPMWITITGGCVAYCGWNFFLKFPKTVPAASPAPDAEPPPQP